MISSISGNSYSSASITQMMQNIFSMMDSDSDGSITKDELQSLSSESSSQIDTFISKLDTDNSSAINQQEFEAGMAKLFQEMKDGSASNAAAPPPPPPPPKDSSGMFSSLDTDSDGYLTVDELASGGVPDAKKIFSEIDTDSDGKISKTESDAFDAKMKENGPPQNSTAINSADSTTASSANLSSIQSEFLNMLMEMISQNNSYTQLTGSANSVYA